MSRRREPAAVKLLKGNPGKQRLADLLRAAAGEPPPRRSHPVIEPPDWLTTPRQRQIFRRTIREAVASRIARPADVFVFARYAWALGTWEQLKAEVDTTGTSYKSTSKHGSLTRKHPAFQNLLDLERILVSLEDKLALNPRARQSYMQGLATLPAHAVMGDDDPEPGGAAEDTPLAFLRRGIKTN